MRGSKPNLIIHHTFMGRYYTGDIEGKFWFAVQPSDDASFFGGEEIEPQYLEYYFDGSHKEAIEGGIAQCVAKLEGYKGKLDAYFNGASGYNPASLTKAIGVDGEKHDELLEWYARLELGEKIRKCVAEKGRCEFEAEL